MRPAPAGIELSVLQNAFVHAPVGVGVCDQDGQFLAVNDALASLLGRLPSEVVGRPFLTFVHPEERAASLAAYFVSVVAAASEPPRQSAHAELRCLTGEGGVVWLAVNWTITPPGEDGAQYGIVHLSDITQRRDVERQLAQAQRRFELAFDAAPIGIAVINAHGRFLQANRALQSMLGYSQRELEQRSFAELCHPGDRAACLAVFDKLLSGECEVHESIQRFRHRAGHTIQARRVVVAARDPEGHVDYLLAQVEDISAERHAAERLGELGIRDQVTGLPTEAVLAVQLELTAHLPRSLVLIRVQHLAGTAGPADESATEQVLARLAASLIRCCREGDLIAQLSQNEFAIVVEDSHATAGAAMAHRVQAALAGPLVTEQATTTLAVSVGIDTDPAGTRPLHAMLHNARAAASTCRPGQLTPPPRRAAAEASPSSRALALEAELAQALRDGQLHLVYQPIIDLADASMHSIEALTRWQHPTLGPISPAQFIPIAERGPTIHTLTAWALETACTDLANWQADHPAAAELSVAVNISALSFTTPDFPAVVHDCLTRTGLHARHLVLEITETAAVEQSAVFIANAAQLRERGLQIALDDFGAGYSSLSRIARLPISELKLDQSLTDPATDQHVTAALLRAAVSLASDLQLTLVAEGIQTPSQLQLLHRCHCPYAQGHLLARPQPAADITRRLTASQTR